ncbi:MAG: DUF1289 domain-containing protein [Pseudomonadota bacterium]
MTDFADTSNAASLQFGTHSPCLGVCELDDETGWCRGCARSSDEIAGWGTTPEDARKEIWDALPERRQRLAMDRHVLPWSPTGILALVARTIRQERGAWIIRPEDGPLARFWTGPRVSARINIDDRGLRAETDSAEFEIAAHDKLRAFAFGPSHRPNAIVLVLPRGRVAFPPRTIRPDDPDTVLRQTTETTLARISEPVVAEIRPNLVADIPCRPALALPDWAAVMTMFVAA